MLFSLALPCLPNHEVVYTAKSQASVCIEAKTIINTMVVVIIIVNVRLIQSYKILLLRSSLLRQLPRPLK